MKEVAKKLKVLKKMKKERPKRRELTMIQEENTIMSEDEVLPTPAPPKFLAKLKALKAGNKVEIVDPKVDDPVSEQDKKNDEIEQRLNEFKSKMKKQSGSAMEKLKKKAAEKKISAIEE